jgi:predicted RNA binding protein YcfA (HicA-like mRNA interferase family)
MPKIPRNLNSKLIIKYLERLGFVATRQKGSHIRLSALINIKQSHITIPNHKPIKIGTLNAILKELSFILNKSKESIIDEILESK